MSEFKPCPFCGEAVKLEINPIPESWGSWTVYCNTCYAEGPGAKSQKEAFAAWNRRYVEVPVWTQEQVDQIEQRAKELRSEFSVITDKEAGDE